MTWYWSSIFICYIIMSVPVHSWNPQGELLLSSLTHSFSCWRLWLAGVGLGFYQNRLNIVVLKILKIVLRLLFF